ncbi:putative glycosyl transferase CAP10 domain-containing protein [Septoria linicola]|nr:putative glycosyl transferase CAP10 domain-containing protein [Septoria linicola]
MQVSSLLQSRFSIVLLSVLIVLQCWLLFGRGIVLHPGGWNSEQEAATASWQYDPSRDARNHALTYDQCSIAFPKLYHEIDRAVAYWKGRKHQISEKDVDIEWTGKGGIRVLIYENELRIIETKDTHHYEDNHDARRVIFVLSQINRALLGAIARGEHVPNVEFAIAVNDYADLPDDASDTHSVFTFDRKIGSKKDDRMWLMPDFNFWAWNPIQNAYGDARRRAFDHDGAIEDKIPKAVWRGNKNINPELRQSLIKTGEGKSWADLQGNWIGIDDFCRYLFSVYTEGHSWSGRLKYLLSCDTATIVHELEFTTMYHHLLVPSGPEQNHIGVKRDWSDLAEKVQHYLAHPEETQKIIRNSVATFRERYITPAAEACYWRHLFRAYKEVAFEPEAFETKSVDTFGKTETVRHLRGVPYELFIGTDGATKT